MRKAAPTPEETARDLQALQLHDLHERRHTADKRALLFWLLLAAVIVLVLKYGAGV